MDKDNLKLLLEALLAAQIFELGLDKEKLDLILLFLLKNFDKIFEIFESDL